MTSTARMPIPSPQSKKKKTQKEIDDEAAQAMDAEQYQKTKETLTGVSPNSPYYKNPETQKAEVSKAPEPEKVNPPQGEIEASPGQTSVTLSDGRVLTGLNKADVRKIAEQQAKKYALPANALPLGTAQAEANRQARLSQLIQLGQQGVLSQAELQAIQEAPIDWGQAATAGTLGNLPSVLTNVGGGVAGGAAIGAGIGALAGGIGAAPGAVIGGVIGGIGGLIKGIWSGTESNIKKQQAGEIAVTKDVLSAARTNMKALVVVASRDPARAEEAITLYYQQLAQVYQAQRKLQLETQGNLNKFMEDGTQDLSDFELFLQPGGYADIQLMRLQKAVLSGKPASDAELLMLYEEMNADE